MLHSIIMHDENAGAHEGQSVVNNFSDEQIRIWILFAKDIFYEYEYEYYSWQLVSLIWIRISFLKNIHKCILIFKYIWIYEIIKPKGTATYKYEDCA